MQAGQSLYLRLRDDFYNTDDIKALLPSTEWYCLDTHGGINFLDGPVEQVPFHFEGHMTSGFVKIIKKYNVKAHTDAIPKNRIIHPSAYYSEWLYKTANRGCVIMIPIEGLDVTTDLYDVNRNRLDGFTLRDGPVLYPSNGNILHGVNNDTDGDRITFQLSFKEDYEYIADKISALGLAKV